MPKMTASQKNYHTKPASLKNSIFKMYIPFFEPHRWVSCCSSWWVFSFESENWFSKEKIMVAWVDKKVTWDWSLLCYRLRGLFTLWDPLYNFNSLKQVVRMIRRVIDRAFDMTWDMTWHVTCDMTFDMTYDTWHMTCDMTHDMTWQDMRVRL